jgi:hypothetical protein
LEEFFLSPFVVFFLLGIDDYGSFSALPAFLI